MMNSDFANKVLPHPGLVILFREFLYTKMCPENLKFFLTVEKYKRMNEQEQREIVSSIINEFLSEVSEYQVNLNYSQYKLAASYLKKIQDNEPIEDIGHIFDETQKIVLDYLSSSTFGFFNSPLYLKIKEAMEEKRHNEIISLKPERIQRFPSLELIYDYYHFHPDTEDSSISVIQAENINTSQPSSGNATPQGGSYIGTTSSTPNPSSNAHNNSSPTAFFTTQSSSQNPQSIGSSILSNTLFFARKPTSSTGSSLGRSKSPTKRAPSLKRASKTMEDIFPIPSTKSVSQTSNVNPQYLTSPTPSTKSIRSVPSSPRSQDSNAENLNNNQKTNPGEEENSSNSNSTHSFGKAGSPNRRRNAVQSQLTSSYIQDLVGSHRRAKVLSESDGISETNKHLNSSPTFQEKQVNNDTTAEPSENLNLNNFTEGPLIKKELRNEDSGESNKIKREKEEKEEILHNEENYFERQREEGLRGGDDLLNTTKELSESREEDKQFDKVGRLQEYLKEALPNQSISPPSNQLQNSTIENPRHNFSNGISTSGEHFERKSTRTRTLSYDMNQNSSSQPIESTSNILKENLEQVHSPPISNISHSSTPSLLTSGTPPHSNSLLSIISGKNKDRKSRVINKNDLLFLNIDEKSSSSTSTSSSAPVSPPSSTSTPQSMTPQTKTPLSKTPERRISSDEGGSPSQSNSSTTSPSQPSSSSVPISVSSSSPTVSPPGSPKNSSIILKTFSKPPARPHLHKEKNERRAYTQRQSKQNAPSVTSPPLSPKTTQESNIPPSLSSSAVPDFLYCFPEKDNNNSNNSNNNNKSGGGGSHIHLERPVSTTSIPKPRPSSPPLGSLSTLYDTPYVTEKMNCFHRELKTMSGFKERERETKEIMKNLSKGEQRDISKNQKEILSLCDVCGSLLQKLVRNETLVPGPTEILFNYARCSLLVNYILDVFPFKLNIQYEDNHLRQLVYLLQYSSYLKYCASHTLSFPRLRAILYDISEFHEQLSGNHNFTQFEIPISSFFLSSFDKMEEMYFSCWVKYKKVEYWANISHSSIYLYHNQNSPKRKFKVCHELQDFYSLRFELVQVGNILSSLAVGSITPSTIGGNGGTGSENFSVTLSGEKANETYILNDINSAYQFVLVLHHFLNRESISRSNNLSDSKSNNCFSTNLSPNERFMMLRHLFKQSYTGGMVTAGLDQWIYELNGLLTSKHGIFYWNGESLDLVSSSSSHVPLFRWDGVCLSYYDFSNDSISISNGIPTPEANYLHSEVGWIDEKNLKPDPSLNTLTGPTSKVEPEMQGYILEGSVPIPIFKFIQIYDQFDHKSPQK